VVEQFDGKDTFFYLDPPYPNTSWCTETSDISDIQELLESIEGKFLLSWSPKSPKIKDFHIKEVEIFRSDQNRTRDTELLISNFPLEKSNTWLAEGNFDNYILETKKKIDDIGQIILTPNYVSWTGSTLYAKNRLPNDADIVIRSNQINPDWQLKIDRVFKKLIGTNPCVHATESGPNWRHFPLYHLALVPVKEAEFVEIGKEEPGFAEKFYEQAVPRAAEPEIINQAETSMKQDRLKMFRFFYGMKPTRAAKPNHRMTIDYFISLFKDEDYPVYSSKKMDGMRNIIFKSEDKVEIWSEDGKNLTKRFPTVVKEVQQLNAEEVILDTEFELWKGKKHQPREAISGYAHSKDIPDDSGVVVNIFDILYFTGEIPDEISKEIL